MRRPTLPRRWSLSSFDDSLLPGTGRQRRGTTVAPPARRTGWVVLGVLAGLLPALLAFAPAAWLAQAVAGASQGRLQLAQAQGTLWDGSALPVLTGGPGSQDAAVLPSRLSWSLRPRLDGLRIELRQDCCIREPLALHWQPGLNGMRLQVQAAADGIGSWPAAWLQGLGAPWNTLRPGGQLHLRGQALELRQSAQGWQLGGQLEIDWLHASSRLSTLDALGSYRIRLSAPAQASPGAPAAQLSLSTLEGALLLSGSGQIGPRSLRFQGQAQAAAGFEPALNNLLNIIGRRAGATSVISIG